MNISAIQKPRDQLYRIAFGLAVFTIAYNIVEGMVSTYFGYEDENLTLFGFGADSFIEVVSGLGIAHMVSRIQRSPESNRDHFERTALKITGFAFYTLVIGLSFSSIYNVLTDHKPDTTSWGIIISLVSILVMTGLVYWKLRVGRRLDSPAIVADAKCTKVCIYMSIVLLLSSGFYELTQFGYIDILGSLGLAYFSFKEGRECFEKAKNDKVCSCDHD